jgi:hypothetical protein
MAIPSPIVRIRIHVDPPLNETSLRHAADKSGLSPAARPLLGKLDQDPGELCKSLTPFESYTDGGDLRLCEIKASGPLDARVSAVPVDVSVARHLRS